MQLTKQELIDYLELMTEHVRQNDSFEGSVEYQIYQIENEDAPVFDVFGILKTGNSYGSGYATVVDWPNEIEKTRTPELRENKTLKRTGVFQTCISCDHWNGLKELCGLVQLRPPANVIANGCERYEEGPPF